MHTIIYICPWDLTYSFLILPPTGRSEGVHSSLRHPVPAPEGSGTLLPLQRLPDDAALLPERDLDPVQREGSHLKGPGRNTDICRSGSHKSPLRVFLSCRRWFRVGSLMALTRQTDPTWMEMMSHAYIDLYWSGENTTRLHQSTGAYLGTSVGFWIIEFLVLMTITILLLVDLLSQK